MFFKWLQKISIFHPTNDEPSDQEKKDKIKQTTKKKLAAYRPPHKTVNFDGSRQLETSYVNNYDKNQPKELR